MQIFIFGSCRVTSSEAFNSKHRVFSTPEYLHTTKEVLQYLDIFNNPEIILNCKHPELIVAKYEQYKQALSDGTYLRELNNSDIVIIELGSLNLMSDERNYYQLNLCWELSKSKTNPNLVEQLYASKRLMGEAELLSDIKEIITRISKPVLFVSHINLNFYDLENVSGRIQNRQEIDSYLELAKERLKINLLKPADVFSNYDYKQILKPKDSNHYNEQGSAIIGVALDKACERLVRPLMLL